MPSPTGKPIPPHPPPDPPPSRPRFDERAYQEHILQRIRENRDRHILVELDCGLGKRVITYRLVTELFPDTKFLITLHSSSSLQETAQYLQVEYGGVEGLAVLHPRTRGPQRRRLLKEARVVVCTARVLANLLRRGDFQPEQFDALVINEVDTILRRVGRRTVLIQPWSYLLDFFRSRWIIGLSGTLRDDHAVLDSEDQLRIRRELQTLTQLLPNALLISMEELAGTDVKEYIRPTTIDVASVDSPVVRALSMVLDTMIHNTRQEIRQTVREVREKGEEVALPQTARLLHLMLEELPIPDELRHKYSGLLMMRKYLYAMSSSSFRRFLHHPLLDGQVDTNRLLADWPGITPKALKARDLASKGKTVILSSYLHMVSEIAKLLHEAGVRTFTLTGRTRDKREMLSKFKETRSPASLILSPVGERDLDLPQADLLIICDVVNTVKTIYQRMKRSRGGRVVFLVYAGTSEEEKVRRLIDNMMQRYPWSTKLGDTTPLKTSTQK